MAENGKEKSLQALVLGLATGLSVREACARSGFAERTVYRRLKDPKFRRRVSEARDRIFERAVNTLAAGSTKAADVLLKLLDDKSSRIRLHAARIVLVAGADLRAYEEFRGRIEALEAKQEFKR